MVKRIVFLFIMFCGVFPFTCQPSRADEPVKAMVASTGATLEKTESQADKQDLNDGIEELRREMKEKPSGSAAVRLGHLLLDKGKDADALLLFDDALRLNPRSIEAKVGRGIALGRLGEYGKAEQALRDALPLNPNPARVHYELGVIFERRGDYAGAVSQYKEGLKRYREGVE